MPDDLPPARRLLRQPKVDNCYDVVVLRYDDRFLRRKRLETVHDEGFLVDLPETVSLDHGDAFELEDGRVVQVIAAEEPVLVVTGDLARLAWHIGNRHTPAQIESGRILIRQDHVLEAMLRQMGATVASASEPFTPEGGAYGHGRTLGHEHVEAEQAKSHGHVHFHSAHHHPEDPEPELEPD